MTTLWRTGERKKGTTSKTQTDRQTDGHAQGNCFQPGSGTMQLIRQVFSSSLLQTCLALKSAVCPGG